MSKKIDIQSVPKTGEKGKVYFVYMVACPKVGELIPSHTCKHCDHCRITMAEYIKCNYEGDMYRASHPFVQ